MALPPSSPSPSWRDPRVFLVGVILGVAALYSMIYTQSCFDRGDQRRATEVVRGYRGRAGARAGAGRTLADAVRSLEPQATGEPVWHAQTLSSCYQYVRVHCIVPSAAGERDYQWDVDINRVAIHPGNELGRRALLDLEGPSGPAGAPDAGAPPRVP